MPHLSLPLILASGSKVRAEILTALKLDFQVQVSDFDEEAAREDVKKLPIAEQALFLAKGKAKAVSDSHPNALILAADQICEHQGEILCKPGNAQNATRQLQQLQNSTHHQHSACCLSLNGTVIWECIQSATLAMRALSDREIGRYIALDQPFSSCGSYMLEHHGKHLFSDIQGNDDVIKGLPSVQLLNFLYQNDYLTLD